jgi:hypothetical protein
VRLAVQGVPARASGEQAAGRDAGKTDERDLRGLPQEAAPIDGSREPFGEPFFEISHN